MRDDLHRGAPVPRIWRSLIRRCAPDASWSEDAAPYAKKAVQELASRIGPGIDALLKSLQDPQISLDDRFTRLQLKASDPLETVMINQARFVLRTEPLSDAIKVVSEAAHAAMEAGIEAHLRSTSLHVLEKNPGAERELMRRMKLSLAEVDLVEIVDAKVHRAPQKRVQLRRAIDLEEDISGG